MIVCINGRRMQGKTTLAYFLAEDRPHRCIFDPRRQFRTTDEISTDGLHVYEMLDEAPEVLVQPWEDVRGVFVITTREFRDWTIEHADQHAVLLVDEARFLDLPNEQYDSFEQVLRFSDTSRVDVIITSHRPQDISVDIRAIADYLVFFRTTQEHDLKVVRERCGEEAAEIVSKLPDKEFLVWDDGTAAYHVEKDSAKWYVDIRPKSVLEVSA